jgi:Protein of unknown function (DUF2585)
MSRPTRLALAILAVLVVTAAVEASMGRLWLGPDGHFGWIETDIWSSGQSQRVVDPYSFSHIVHGFLFYGLLWLVARRWPMSTRFLAAVALEGGWEILENSPLIIDRYRAVTIAQGYVGDSILNSLSDIAMCAGGFLLAANMRVLTSVAFIAAVELLMLFLIRDNLTLNIVMLVAPIEAIKTWQMAGH